MKIITVELPDDALAGTVCCVSGSYYGLRLKTCNFDFQVKDGTVVKFEDENNNL